MTEEKALVSGLTQKEAERLIKTYGENVLTASKRVKPAKIFFAQFKDLLVLILLISTVLSVAMGEVGEAVTIIIIVFLNALLGFFQEFKTERTLEALKKMSAPTAKVVRDGKERIIEASQIVQGDVINLEAGDRVPADCVILRSYDLYADESILTGESKSVKKSEKLSNGKQNRVYMGTAVTRGRATVKTEKTGMNTEMGAIAGMIDEITAEQTPLQKRLEQLGKYIAVGCLVVCAAVAVTGIMRGEKVFDMIVTGISLSVAAVPEGLPAIVTISLALAVSRMVKRGAVIRKLDAVETLGCASVICSDKTGTITENKMTVKTVVTPDAVYSVTGVGSEAEGTINPLTRHADTDDSCLDRLCAISVLCSSAHIYPEDNTKPFSKPQSYQTAGEATEVALVILAAKNKMLENRLNNKYKRVGELPFSSERKRMSVAVKDAVSGEIFLYTKGAADVIIEKCAYIAENGKVRPITTADKTLIMSQSDAMAKKAMRVMGFCYKGLQSENIGPEDESSMIFVGLTGMIDPPRKEVYEAIRTCRKAGIRPVMITGDHKLTAKAIAQDINLLTENGGVITGDEIDAISDEELARRVNTTDVYARVTPAHKLKIVRALKKNGNIVAMTGDGVNDAPAVKEADIGAAMGKTGTDVTKQAASVILLDDNFATLVSAVEEGRVIYANIRKFIRYLISCNIGEVVTMFLGMIMGLPVVLLPIQILLVNLVTDGLPAIALGLEPAEGDEMTHRPRGKTEGIFSGGLLSTILFRGMLIGLSTLGAFVSVYKFSGNLPSAQTAALATLVFSQLIHVFECKSEKNDLFKINLFNNIKLISAVGVSLAVAVSAIYFTPLCEVFATVKLTAPQLITAVAYSFSGSVISHFVRKALSFRQKLKPEITPQSGGEN